MIFELIYTSLPTHDNPDVNAILEVARRRNVEMNVTGLLCYDGTRFLQILEGDETVVGDIYASIAADHRHRSIDILYTGLAKERSFQSWSMAYENIPSDMLEILNADVDIKTFKTARAQVSETSQSLGSRLFRLFFQSSYKIEGH